MTGVGIVAPIKAFSKTGKVKKYEQISDVDIFNAAILDEQEINTVYNGIVELHKKYYDIHIIKREPETSDGTDIADKIADINYVVQQSEYLH